MKKKIQYQAITFKVDAGPASPGRIVSAETVTKSSGGSQHLGKRILRHAVKNVSGDWITGDGKKR